jgi:hypothetical protein
MRTDDMEQPGPRQPAGDDGVALVAAIAIIGLVSTLMLAMLVYVQRETGSTGKDRQRSSAVAAAEGQVDLTLARIQEAAVTSLPCGTLAPVTGRQSAADSFSTVTQVTYYTAAGSPIDCAALATATVDKAKVTSVATSGALAGQSPARRTVESMVQMTPATTVVNGLDKAIYGDAGVAFDNSSTMLSDGAAPNADVYSNEDVTCVNSGEYRGSLLAQKRIYLDNSCTIAVDAHAGTGVSTLRSSNRVMGRVLVHRGNVDLGIGSSSQVGQQVRASGTIRWDGCTGAKCFPGDTTVAPVPPNPFPILNWNATTEAQWRAAGYNNIVTNQNDCTAGAANNPSRWIQDNDNSTTRGKTVLVTNCRISYGNSVDLVLADDLAVFARGGFELINSIKFMSNSSTVRRLHLVHPYDAAPDPCTTTGIRIGNSVTFESSVNTFLYSPCNIIMENSTQFQGQIYAGGVARFVNSFAMQYRPVPVFGATFSTSSAVAASYTLSMVYKRERQ